MIKSAWRAVFSHYLLPDSIKQDALLFRTEFSFQFPVRAARTAARGTRARDPRASPRLAPRLALPCLALHLALPCPRAPRPFSVRAAVPAPPRAAGDAGGAGRAAIGVTPPVPKQRSALSGRARADTSERYLLVLALLNCVVALNIGTGAFSLRVKYLSSDI